VTLEVNSAVPLPASDPELRQVGQEASPTWELELLISGALIFALMRLPGAVERFFSSLEPHTTATSYQVVFFVALYVKAIAFTLLVTFVVHGIVRASWVALMGLHSVFPGGIRWEELKVGPISKEIYREFLPPLPKTIARLDNFASALFSFAFLIVAVFAFTIVFFGAVSAISYGLAQTFHDGRHTREYVIAIAAVVIVPSVVLGLYDKKWGDRLDPHGRPRRIIKWVLRTFNSINILRLTGPILVTLMTNVGRTKITVAFYAAVVGLVLVTSFDRLARRGLISVNGYDFFGNSSRLGIDSRFYESQRDPEAQYGRLPSIQADIIRDPYVKLFIPYFPRRHNPAVARVCPGIKPLQTRGIQLVDPPVADSLATPVLECLARIHNVAVNAVPRPDLEFRFYEQPVRGTKGIIAYIRADTLPAGRNVITLMPVPPEVLPKDTTNAAWNRPYVIWFWK
jgi:hypothetical protein